MEEEGCRRVENSGKEYGKRDSYYNVMQRQRREDRRKREGEKGREEGEKEGGKEGGRNRWR